MRRNGATDFRPQTEKLIGKKKSSLAIKGNDKLYNTATDGFLEVKVSLFGPRRCIK